MKLWIRPSPTNRCEIEHHELRMIARLENMSNLLRQNTAVYVNGTWTLYVRDKTPPRRMYIKHLCTANK